MHFLHWLILSLVLVTVLAIVWGSVISRLETRKIRLHLEELSVTTSPTVFNSNELSELPAPLQRYFKAVLIPGTKFISAVIIQHSGTFNFSRTKDSWKPFRSDQRITLNAPGFDWNAKIRILPAVHVHVHDAYIGGLGLLHASLFGSITVARVQGKGEIARGELMRFVAEAVWYPTLLLPGPHIIWTEVSQYSARALFKNGEVEVSLLFKFNEMDLIDTIYSEARGRMVGGKIVQTPWEGHFWNYTDCSGIKVPLDADVGWILPEGEKPYWRGHIDRISYEWGGDGSI